MGEKTMEKGNTRYWQRQSFKHLKAMRAAKEAGLFPKNEGWRNVVEHELVEAEACDLLAEALGIPSDARQNLVQAASLHDVGKRKEVELMRKSRTAGYEQGKREQIAILKRRGYSDEVIRLTELVDAQSCIYFVEDPKASTLKIRDDIGLPELIIHYVDDITLNSELVPLKKRVAYVKQRYRDTDDEGKKVFGGRAYSDVQYEASRQIEERFAAKLGVSPPEKLPEWIKGKIVERIEQEKLETR